MTRTVLLGTLNKTEESNRIVIALGILATVLGAVVLLPNSIWGIAKVPLVISGIFSFLYILTTGANLKYKNVGEIADFAFSEKFRRWCFNECINTYGYNFVVVFGVGFAHLLGSNVASNAHIDTKFWLGFALAGALFLAIAILGAISKSKESKKS